MPHRPPIDSRFGRVIAILDRAMALTDFVHLRVHTAYSLSEGAIKIKDLVRLCVERDMPAIAVTDTNNLFGALEFAMAASAAGIQPIIGCQLSIARMEADAGGGIRHGRPLGHDNLVLLVQNEDGYRNLVALVSKAYLEAGSGDAHVCFEDVEAHSGGLIALSGGPSGALGRLLADGQVQKASGVLQRLRGAFSDRLYIEINRHGEEIERRIEDDLINLAMAHDLPLVATNDVYFADPPMYEAHDVLLCIAQGTHVADPDRRRLTPEHHFREAADMRAVFADLPEAVDNTVVIARRCAFMPSPHAPILPSFPIEEGKTEADTLREAASAGLEARLKGRELDPKPYYDRLEFELDVIISMGFPGYFLIVADFIKWAKEQGIPVGPGRGSGAGSVVAWSLTITDLDPLRFGLLFERFLNPDRVSMPDFDIDFCQDRRDEVIRYVQEQYGADRVAQIITFGSLQARAALRDVGRVLGMPYGQVDRICKLVPFNPAKPPTLAEALAQEPQLREIRRGDETVARLIDIAMKLEGLYRHTSTHAAGVVIADRPLTELIPLYRDPRSDLPATQFPMKYTEMAGLVKFDFLGLKTLTVLDRALKLIAKRQDPPDLLALPLDDPATYAMLGRGDATGVFQMESAGMRDALRHMKPDCFEDLIALVALYRPGPMDNIPRYNNCKHGREAPDYLHPDLEEILRETFGVIIYQEQVMQIAQRLSGFSLAAADLLRRAMGKKIKAEMEAQRGAFIDGATARGVDAAKAEQIFEQVDKFAGYGFNKSHAAAYALVAYQTAWLKANHPVEFMAALMSLDLDNTDKLIVFKQELQRLDVSLLPPDVNLSEASFSVEIVANGIEKRAIRYALAAIKNVGEQAMTDLVAERERNGTFGDEFEFARRLGGRIANRRQMENLVRAGALDGLNSNRRQVFESIDMLVKLRQAAAEEREANQTNLFGEAAEDLTPIGSDRPEIADWSRNDRLEHEFEALGLHLSAHPLDTYETRLRRLRVVPSNALGSAGGGGSRRLAGIVSAKKERTSSKGNRFADIELSDSGGRYSVRAFSEVLASARDLLEINTRVLVSVEVRSDGEGISLMAQRIESLDEAVKAVDTGIEVRIEDPGCLETVRGEIDGWQQGRGRVHLVIGIDPAHEVELILPGGYAVPTEAPDLLGTLAGVAAVNEV